MGIKTDPQPPYSPDLAPCDFWLFPKLKEKLGGCRNNWGDERGCDEGHWHAHTRGLPWILPDVVGTVQQVHCSRRRLLRRGLESHVCTNNKSAHSKKSLETYLMIIVYIYTHTHIYIYIYMRTHARVYACVRAHPHTHIYIYISNNTLHF